MIITITMVAVIVLVIESPPADATINGLQSKPSSFCWEAGFVCMWLQKFAIVLRLVNTHCFVQSFLNFLTSTYEMFENDSLQSLGTIPNVTYINH